VQEDGLVGRNQLAKKQIFKPGRTPGAPPVGPTLKCVKLLNLIMAGWREVRMGNEWEEE